MKIASDDFLPNCIFTWASAAYEYQQIDSKKGCDWGNSVHATFFFLKLIPFVGNAAYLSQKLWRLGSSCCGNTKEKIESTSQNSLQNPNSVETSTETVTEIQPPDSLNTEKKKISQLLRSHPGVLISPHLTYNLKEMQNDFVFKPSSAFIHVNSKAFDDWEKGTTEYLNISFISVGPNNHRAINRDGKRIELIDNSLHCPGGALIDEEGQFWSTRLIESKGCCPTLEDLCHAFSRLWENMKIDALTAPISKQALREELETIEIPAELREHPLYAGKFINSQAFLETGSMERGCFYYSLQEKCFIVNVKGRPSFTYEDGKVVSEHHKEDLPLVEWLSAVSEALNPNQKETLKLLQNHPAVMIADIDIYNKEAMLAEIKKNYVWQDKTVFLAVPKSNLEDWQKGVKTNLIHAIPRLCFIEICDHRLVYHPLAINIDESGHFYSKGDGRFGTHPSIEELAIAHAKFLEKPEYRLKAPILKTTLEKELNSAVIPQDILDHPRFAGKFLDRVDFLEKGVRKLGDFYYSMADKGYWVKTAVAHLFFTYENGKPKGDFYHDETSLDNWFKKIEERFGE